MYNYTTKDRSTVIAGLDELVHKVRCDRSMSKAQREAKTGQIEELRKRIVEYDENCGVKPKIVKQIRATAREMYESEGSIEIDEGAPLSTSDDGGAYVMAWVWVPYGKRLLNKED